MWVYVPLGKHQSLTLGSINFRTHLQFSLVTFHCWGNRICDNNNQKGQRREKFGRNRWCLGKGMPTRGKCHWHWRRSWKRGRLTTSPHLRALVFMGPSSINNIDVMTTVRIEMNRVQAGFIITRHYSYIHIFSWFQKELKMKRFHRPIVKSINGATLNWGQTCHLRGTAWHIWCLRPLGC